MITKLRKQKKIHVILLLLFKKELLNQIRRVNLSKLEFNYFLSRVQNIFF